MKGRGGWEIDPERITEAVHWDEAHGVATNLRGMAIPEIPKRYWELWQVECRFRITKNGMKVPPPLSLDTEAHLRVCGTVPTIVGPDAPLVTRTKLETVCQ